MPRIRFSIAGIMFAVALVAVNWVSIKSFLFRSGWELFYIELYVGLIVMANVLTIAMLGLLSRLRRREPTAFHIDFIAAGALVALAFGAFCSWYPDAAFSVLNFLARQVEHTSKTVFGHSIRSAGSHGALLILIVAIVYSLPQICFTLVICHILGRNRGRGRFWPEYPEVS